ncbi:DUF998 domain-containing protein [Arthrobacter sp. UM1]|uniref:DUF998 domain-containing protein n=1 Tax=Arthrobacter sp. UM1 TaxID=2766776 RepID=UPI001CF6B9C6|nr:DUF998 domain-containing protein [Arthrobacter sp. UM1]MCB4208829.1 alpha/beta fold hydrolase [Arthrobacter sp. UM1]
MHLTRGTWRVLLVAMALYCTWAVALGGPRMGYLDPFTSYVSELSASGQQHRWLFRTGDAAAGLLVLLAAAPHVRRPFRVVGVPKAARDGAQVRWLARLRTAVLFGLLLFGASTVLDALWTFACPRTQDTACLAAETAGGLPWHHEAHIVTSTLVGVGLTLVFLGQIAAGVLACRIARAMPSLPRRRMRQIRARTLATVLLSAGAALTLGVSILLGPPVFPDYASSPMPLGIVQRLSLVFTVLALAVSLAPGDLSAPPPRAAAGPPSVVIHPGLGVPLDTFDDVRWRLEDQHLIPWPRPGMDGAPSRPDGDFPGSCADAEALLDALETAAPDGGRVERALLVGHSMAGPVIETFARLYPERVAGLVFLDASIPPSGGRSKGTERHAVARSVRRAWLRRPLTRAVSAVTGDPDRFTNVDVENAAYPWYIEEATRVRGERPMPDVPVEVVVALRGLPFFGLWARWQRDYVRLLQSTGAPRTRLRVIRPSGHIVQKEHPAQVAEIVRRVLRAADDPASGAANGTGRGAAAGAPEGASAR